MFYSAKPLLRRYFIQARIGALVIGLIVANLALLGASGLADAKPLFSAIAVDARTGKVLFSSDADGLRHPASLTKVMTLYLLFEDLKAEKIKLNSSLKVSPRAASMAPSKLGLKPGSTISVEDAIKALVTRSANDAAATIGENLEGSESNFADRMTRKARAIGMSKTTFKNASGLPNPAQVTTARDMATLSLRIQRDFPQYYPYFRLTSFTFKGQTIRTHNRLLGKYQGTDGIKTGYIHASGFNLTTSAKRGEKRIVGVVMGSNSGSARNRYMMKMLDRTFPKCVDGDVIAAAAGTSNGAIAPVPPKTKTAASVTTSLVASADAGEVKPIAPASIAALAAGEEESETPDPRVLEAKIEETAVVPTDEPMKVADIAPEKLPFAVKKKAMAVMAEPTWNIQIGAYPKKEEARLKLKEIRASGFKFLSGKQAFTVEVQKGAKTVYRARFSGFTQQAAKEACAQLSKKGLKCQTFSPQS